MFKINLQLLLEPKLMLGKNNSLLILLFFLPNVLFCKSKYTPQLPEWHCGLNYSRGIYSYGVLNSSFMDNITQHITNYNNTNNDFSLTFDFYPNSYYDNDFRFRKSTSYGLDLGWAVTENDLQFHRSMWLINSSNNQIENRAIEANLNNQHREYYLTLFTEGCLLEPLFRYGVGIKLSRYYNNVEKISYYNKDSLYYFPEAIGDSLVLHPNEYSMSRVNNYNGAAIITRLLLPILLSKSTEMRLYISLESEIPLQLNNVSILTNINVRAKVSIVLNPFYSWEEFPPPIEVK